MANFEITNPVYNGQLRRLEPTDPNHADTFNANFRQLIENDQALSGELAQIGYYISSSYIGTDIADILQNALNSANIGAVHITTGDYIFSHKVSVPDGKSVIMAGNNQSDYLRDSEASNKVFTKITPIFDNDYFFSLGNMSSIKGGFLNCNALTTGGGIEVDFSQKGINRCSIQKTVIYGYQKWDCTAVLLNGDRPSGTLPGYLYFLEIDCGIIGFGKAIHLLRHDAYTLNDGTVNGMAWCTAVRINGKTADCQRSVYYDTTANGWAGGSSYINLVIQGGAVPDPNIPAVEIGGDDTTLSCQFHDLSATAADQNVRYKLRTGTTNAIITKYPKGSADIQDSGTKTTYLQDNYPIVITTINGDVSVADGWYYVNDGVCTVNFRYTNLPISAGWTTIYTLPFPCNIITRKIVIADSGSPISIMCANSNLQYINNTAAVQTTSIQITYPIVP